jgi:hypothetical protein
LREILPEGIGPSPWKGKNQQKIKPKVNKISLFLLFLPFKQQNYCNIETF